MKLATLATAKYCFKVYPQIQATYLPEWFRCDASLRQTPEGLNIPRPQHSVDISTDPKPSVSTIIFDPTLCRPHTWETCRNLEHSELCHTFARRSGREKNCIHSLYEFVWIFVCLKQRIVDCTRFRKIRSMYLRFWNAFKRINIIVILFVSSTTLQVWTQTRQPLYLREIQHRASCHSIFQNHMAKSC